MARDGMICVSLSTATGSFPIYGDCMDRPVAAQEIDLPVFRRAGVVPVSPEHGTLSLGWRPTADGRRIDHVGLSYDGTFFSSVPSDSHPQWYRSPWEGTETSDWRLSNFVASCANDDDEYGRLWAIAREVQSWSRVTLLVEGVQRRALSLTFSTGLGTQTLLRAVLPSCNLMIWRHRSPEPVERIERLSDAELQALLEAHNAFLDSHATRSSENQPDVLDS